MSVERSFEAWEEVQRHGLDLADKLAQGFSGLIHTHISPPSIPWPPLPSPPKPPLFDVDFAQNIFPREFIFTPINGSLNGYHNNPIVDIGNRIGQAGAEFGGFFNGLVQQVMGVVSIVPFLGGGGESDKGMVKVVHGGGNGVGGPGTDMSIIIREDLGSLADQLGDLRLGENEGDSGGGGTDDVSGFNLKIASLFGKSQGSVNITSAYDSRSRDVQNSIVARGDLWRLEASSGGSTSGTENSSLFLVQLGPLLFIRDTTFLLPIHLSKRHLLWYGYDKKNGLHSICPAVWSKHRRWLVMSMICLNPFACSFMDVQFPNGQLTYVAGEGLSTSAFLPICGGLLQVQGQYPGEMRFSFSCKNKWGTRVTPMVQWPDKSLALGFTQDLAWKRSGLLVRPTIQFNLCPTVGGSDPGVRAELIHSVKEQLSLIYGCSCSTYPSAYASVSLGRSKWNGNVGNTGVVLRVETPLNNVGRPAFSVQLNSGIEF